MSFTDVCRNFACGMGKFIGGSINVLAWPRKALRKSTEKPRPLPLRETIRAIVTEELIRLVGKETELTRIKLEERLQIMAETILALQERINELGARGPVSEADMWEAVDSLKAAEALTNDERVVLVKVFRQNVALQKPELVGDAIN
ncbi:MAG: hypothetical protein ACYSW7_00105 [Planctomycetota bacterium]